MSLEITEDLIARQPPEAQAIIRILLAKMAELEAKLGKMPANSSLPPSSQHPHAKPQRPRKKPKRQRGGQRGHTKSERPLIPTKECRVVIPLKPRACRRCGTKLCGEDEEPLRRQAWELPEVKLRCQADLRSSPSPSGIGCNGVGLICNATFKR